MTDPDWRARRAFWRDVTGHVIAVTLTTGFFGIVVLAITGWVNLTDPTTATFTGTVAGYAIGQLSRPLAFYFGIARNERRGHGDDRPGTADVKGGAS